MCRNCAEIDAPCATGGVNIWQDEDGREKSAWCPRYEHAPRSTRGAELIVLCNMPGVWRRSGMSGLVSGIDTAEAARRLGRPLTADDYTLIAAIENGALAGQSEIRSDEDDAAAPEEEDAT